MVLMFTLLPMYYSDNYYNILNDKRDVFWLFSRILFAVIAVSLCVSLILTIRKHECLKTCECSFQRSAHLMLLC